MFIRFVLTVVSCGVAIFAENIVVALIAGCLALIQMLSLTLNPYGLSQCHVEGCDQHATREIVVINHLGVDSHKLCLSHWARCQE